VVYEPFPLFFSSRPILQAPFFVVFLMRLLGQAGVFPSFSSLTFSGLPRDLTNLSHLLSFLVHHKVVAFFLVSFWFFRVLYFFSLLLFLLF